MKSSDLDPDDWNDFRSIAHDALGGMIEFIETIRERPVWQQAPGPVIEQFRQPLPLASQDLRDVIADFESFIMPYSTGNLHPLFLGWVHGAGTPVGMVAEMLAAGLNANCGGRNHIAIAVEQQIVRWAAEMLGFPDGSSGIFVTGTSAANLSAVVIARNFAIGDKVRQEGLRQAGLQLVAYTSAEAHGSIRQAIEVAGVGSQFLRMIPVDARGAIRIDLLTKQIAADRDAGLKPFLVAGTAGSVNAGTMDDLSALADLCQAEGLWFHVDGAFGALCALSPRLKPLVRGIERAASVAFDFHKWAHVPYDAGFLLVRDAEAHRRTYYNPTTYLHRMPSGLGAGEVWPCDLGFDLSRSFRALKTWFTFRVFGAEKIAECIERTCDLAKYLEERLKQTTTFTLCAPVTLNIVCFALSRPDADELTKRIVIDLQERGVAAPSSTLLGGKAVIRAAIVNHRTTEADMDAFLDALEESARRVMSAA
ncbi:MAG: pyridoxal phosphate-dependent decarboxylase family protein [Burkholderiaceae bacterium]